MKMLSAMVAAGGTGSRGSVRTGLIAAIVGLAVLVPHGPLAVTPLATSIAEADPVRARQQAAERRNQAREAAPPRAQPRAQNVRPSPAPSPQRVQAPAAPRATASPSPSPLELRQRAMGQSRPAQRTLTPAPSRISPSRIEAPQRSVQIPQRSISPPVRTFSRTESRVQRTSPLEARQRAMGQIPNRPTVQRTQPEARRLPHPETMQRRHVPPTRASIPRPHDVTASGRDPRVQAIERRDRAVRGEQQAAPRQEIAPSQRDPRLSAIERRDRAIRAQQLAPRQETAPSQSDPRLSAMERRDRARVQPEREARRDSPARLTDPRLQAIERRDRAIASRQDRPERDRAEWDRSTRRDVRDRGDRRWSPGDGRGHWQDHGWRGRDHRHRAPVHTPRSRTRISIGIGAHLGHAWWSPPPAYVASPFLFYSRSYRPFHYGYYGYYHAYPTYWSPAYVHYPYSSFAFSYSRGFRSRTSWLIHFRFGHVPARPFVYRTTLVKPAVVHVVHPPVYVTHSTVASSGWFGSSAVGTPSVATTYRDERVGVVLPEPVEYPSVEPQPRHVSTGADLGMTYLALGDGENALRVLSHHLTEYPNDTEAIRAIGLAYLLLGEGESGIRQIGRAYRLSPWLSARALPSGFLTPDDHGYVLDVATDIAVQRQNPDAWLTVAVLMQMEERFSAAGIAIDRARQAGLDRQVAERFEGALPDDEGY